MEAGNENLGLVHLYHGTGKGKTTAAMGLALRALGQGLQVTVVQFLKDGCSGELEPLKKLGAKVYSGPGSMKFSWIQTEQERRETRAAQTTMLEAALEERCDLLVLDEACGACRTGLVDESVLKKAVLSRPAGCEVVLTGREPAPWMQEAADYITRMEGERHPFERGIRARKGVEF